MNFSQFDDFNNKSGVSDSQSVKSQNKNAQQGRDSLNFDQFGSKKNVEIPKVTNSQVSQPKNE